MDRNLFASKKLQVCIGHAKSGTWQLKQLVPQGSVGGSILFNCYCSMITSAIDKGCEIELRAFADDHNLRKTFTPALLDNEREDLQNHCMDEHELFED